MPSWIPYKGLQVPDSPSGAAGVILKDDLELLADRAPYSSSSNPTTSDDSGDGFAVGQLWINASTNTIWICTDNSLGAAMWRPAYARIDNAIVLVPEAGVGGGSDARAIQLDSGGNARGTNAIDFQTDRTAGTQVASGEYSHVRGKNCTASGDYSTAIGSDSTASGRYSSVNGSNSSAVGVCSAASGYNCSAIPWHSSASGFYCTASGYYSTVSGYESIASGGFAFGTGYYATASGNYSRARGSNATSSGSYSTASGLYVLASGNYSMASGWQSTASAAHSAAIGFYGIADKTGQHAIGANVNAQRSSLQWTAFTPNASQAEMYLPSGGTERATVPANSVWVGHIEFAGVKTDLSKGIVGSKWFSIKRDGSNNTALVGSITDIVSTTNFGSSGYSILIDADDTNESLRIRVTGAASETVRWTATAYFLELRF